MSERGHGQVRRSQVITTYGPGALIDLPKHSAIVGGLDYWPNEKVLSPIDEPRLSKKLEVITGLANPRLYAPPAEGSRPGEKGPFIRVSRFPEWFVVREESTTGEFERSRRMVHRKALTKGRFEGLHVVATRFVRACTNGHVDDIEWRTFAHRGPTPCRRQLWLDERGTSGDLADLSVRCECGVETRSLDAATVLDPPALLYCPGKRPWLGEDAREDCGLPSRLLVRTATNAYFPQVVTVLSLPERGAAIDLVVTELWDELQYVSVASELDYVRKKPAAARALSGWSADEILGAITRRLAGPGADRALKLVELDALLAVPEGYGEDVPIDPNFHARRLPEHVWRGAARAARGGVSLPSGGGPSFDSSRSIEGVIQVHRLREVMSLIGFTRFEASTPDQHGEIDTDVVRAQLATEPRWFPACENRGEGVMVLLRPSAVKEWSERPEVIARVNSLLGAYGHWATKRSVQRPHPGGPYVLLHTLAHLLLQALAMRCGYPASAIRERIYSDHEQERYGVLLYTGSPDAEGTLGGLVQQARHIEEHLADALRQAALCSNDPICAQHEPESSMEERWLHGAACHGCTLVAESSCEMRNDYLDRALVVPVIGHPGAAFFSG
ncbi:MAG: DUF1998 domain-containing protein [Candidatus Eisenbacteria bacterium]|nr:DUF1998 domain-containing protein [Candidatus Eisenbacteria bacterium]